jgi:hypothetical protein
MSQEDQLAKANETVPTDFHTSADEEELLYAKYGEPTEDGVYGARD